MFPTARRLNGFASASYPPTFAVPVRRKSNLPGEFLFQPLPLASLLVPTAGWFGFVEWLLNCQMMMRYVIFAPYYFFAFITIRLSPEL